MKLLKIEPLGRRLPLAWLLAATAEYLFSPEKSLSSIAVLTQMSFFRVIAITLAVTAILQWIDLKASVERWLMLGAFCILSAVSLSFNFAWGFFAACLAAASILTVYAIFGRAKEQPLPKPIPDRRLWLLPLGLLTAAFFALVSAWTVCRFLALFNSTYDFGIFTQMFHNMAENGSPMTTLERSKALSHFQVHVSPIYYLMLPFYWLFPNPVTLQILQAAVLASAVIPLWKLGRLYALSGLQKLLVCAVLLVFPAFSGGTGYDLHENCFLTPVLLWLFYAAECKNRKLCILFAFLALTIKEDAAVYVAVIALWMLLRHKDVFWLYLLGGAVAWFFAVTAYLRHFGDGVMSNRYDNFIYDGTGSLLTVVKAALMCPMKLLFECFEKEKFEFLRYTLLPLAFLPFITRKYERFLLLIPYFLVNLMSDYPYQHNIFFQYCYGSLACLLYLTTVNLADLKKPVRIAALFLAFVIGCSSFAATVLPKSQRVIEAYTSNAERYDAEREALAFVPDRASVTATAFYTPHLSHREILYDLLYCTTDQLLSTQYVVLEIHAQNEYANYNSHDLLHDGYNNLVFLLERNGYTLVHELEDVLVIYKR